MKTAEVIEFFDSCAPSWDENMVRSDEKINFILDCGGVRAGARVLDVACGTGVLFPDYIRRGVAHVTGVDISPEMARIAAEKAQGENIDVICADAQLCDFKGKFDCVMIYNAFPHFPKPELLFEHLSAYLLPGGRLTVAHGMSREQIDAHHHSNAYAVSMGLMDENELAALMSRWFKVDTIVSDDEKYVVSGSLKSE